MTPLPPDSAIAACAKSRRVECFLFNLHDQVIVREIQRPGVVTVLRVDPLGRSYLVAYWNDSVRKEEWLYDFELELRAGQ